MSDKKEDSVTSIFQSLEALREVNDDKPGSYILQSLLFTKSDEIINVFSDAFPDVKAKVVNLMNELDPANGSKYQSIMNKN
jgi:hypothetical protein